MENIKNIIFDLGGVILNIDYNKTAQAFIDLGLVDFNIIYSQLQQTQLFNLYETGQISSADFIEALQVYIPNASVEEIVKAWNAMLLDYEMERFILLQQLKSQYNIYLLSNTNELHEIAFNKRLKEMKGYDNLDPFFEKVYLSHHIQMRKPDITTFQFILDDQNLVANETLFIDDSPQHIEGAKALGLQTIHLKAPQTILDIFKP